MTRKVLILLLAISLAFEAVERMAFRIILFMLPAVIFAKISVNLDGTLDGNDYSNLFLKFDGNEVGIISKEERNTFKLNDNSLKNAINAYFGRRPNDIYLKTPTPWGNLYNKYGWQQVTRILRPQNGRILGIKLTPVVVMDEVLENESSKPATFTVGISREVANSVSSSWHNSYSLNIGQEISYGFNIGNFSAGGTTSFSYTSSWGKNHIQTQTVTVGTSSSVQIALEAGQSVEAKLLAFQGSIEIEMEYQASLVGHLLANYRYKYKGHHFWFLKIGKVMKAGNISNLVTARETIKIDYYGSSKVVVRDRPN